MPPTAAAPTRCGGRPHPCPVPQQPGTLAGRLPPSPLRIAATPSTGVTAPGTLRAGDQCKRHRRDSPGSGGHPHRGDTSSAEPGSRSGRRPPVSSGSWNEYRPSMLTWCRTNGERRATSLFLPVNLPDHSRCAVSYRLVPPQRRATARRQTGMSSSSRHAASSGSRYSHSAAAAVSAQTAACSVLYTRCAFRLGFLGPALARESAAAVPRQDLLHDMEGAEGERECRRCRGRLQLARLLQLQELLASGLNAGAQRHAALISDGNDIARVGQAGGSGGRNQLGFGDHDVGPAPVAARLAQPARPPPSMWSPRVRVVQARSRPLPGICVRPRSRTPPPVGGDWCSFVPPRWTCTQTPLHGRTGAYRTTTVLSSHSGSPASSPRPHSHPTRPCRPGQPATPPG